jgi:hypothetical protein
MRTESPLLEGEDDEEDVLRTLRRRSQPPSRHKIEEEDESAELRRQRSYHNMHKVDRRDSKGDGVGIVSGVGSLRDGALRTAQIV